MRTPAPVVVIGGGMVGCSALYHLTRMGWTDVVLLDLDDGDIDPARSPRCWPRARALPVPRPPARRGRDRAPVRSGQPPAAQLRSPLLDREPVSIAP